jgi:acyl carrier protein
VATERPEESGEGQEPKHLSVAYTLMNADLAEKIKSLIAEHFGIEPDKLTPETEIASFGIDSLAMIEFMFQMEEKFNVRMADSRVPLVTVADVIAEIERTVREQQPAQAA